MVSVCVTPIKGRMARLVKLDTCGNPVTGASSAMVISKGYISVEMKPQYEDGQEYLQRAADGTPCVNQKDDGFLKRMQLTMNWCVMDPDAIVIMTGARLLSTSATGTGVAFGESVASAQFSLELWQDITGRGACSASGIPQYVYWAFTNVGNGQVQDYKVENGALQFSIQAETTAVGSRWGTGVGWGSTFWLPTNTGSVLNSDEHYAYNITTVAPPTAVCGAQTLAG